MFKVGDIKPVCTSVVTGCNGPEEYRPPVIYVPDTLGQALDFLVERSECSRFPEDPFFFIHTMQLQPWWHKRGEKKDNFPSLETQLVTQWAFTNDKLGGVKALVLRSLTGKALVKHDNTSSVPIQRRMWFFYLHCILKKDTKFKLGNIFVVWRLSWTQPQTVRNTLYCFLH